MTKTEPHSAAFALDRTRLREIVAGGEALEHWGEPLSRAIGCAAEHAFAYHAIKGPDAVDLIIEPILSDEPSIIIAVRPSGDCGRCARVGEDSPLTSTWMLGSRRVDVDTLVCATRDEFARTADTLANICEHANTLLAHLDAQIRGQAARLNAPTLMCRDERMMLLSCPAAARDLADALNRAKASGEPRTARWHCRGLAHDDAAEIRQLCDHASIPVPASVVNALVQTSKEDMWMTLTRPQALAAAEWTYDGPGADAVQLELRGEILNVSQGDDGESLDAAGCCVEYRPVQPGVQQLVVAFPLDPEELKRQVEQAATLSMTQVTLTVSR